MGKKGGKFKKKENSVPVKNKSVQSDDEDMMNDEIDAFHKNRDVVSLNIGDDMEGSDEDNEHPVYDFEDEDEDEDEDEEDDPPKGMEAKIKRTQKYMREKFGGVEDEQPDDDDDEEPKVWGRKGYHGSDVNYKPQESDNPDAIEEELEAIKIAEEKARNLTNEDYGLEVASEVETGREPTFEEILDHRKSAAKASLDKETKDEDGTTYEIVKKDLNALTKEEQIEIVYSSAPELIGLLSELNDALEQLEHKVNPLVDKIKGRESAKKGGMHYLEVKQLLLQSFCQAITFYLLLKSEGQPVRDHPVVSRLVEIKSLLDKVKEMDEKLPFDVEDILNKDLNNVTVMKLVEEKAVLNPDSLTNGQMLSTTPSGKQEALVEPVKAADLNISRTLKNTEAHHKQQDKQVGLQSMEMLKTRALLEEKWSQEGVFRSTAPKNGKIKEHGQRVNRQLETLDDFVDEAMEIDAVANGTSKISQQLTLRPNKRKVISGDDDLPRRDDIGERRRKHELRVLAGAGVNSGDDVKDDETANLSSDEDADINGEGDSDADLELYNQVEQKHAAKRAAKSVKYSRTVDVSSLPVVDTVIDGKRQINKQIDKNRGLTRSRNKDKKNPRKNYRNKHKKADIRRKGQVREVRKPTGPYGGEASGINVGVSHSRKFNY